jgi:hypothetical protein
MTQDPWKERLVARLYGELDPEEERELEQRLADSAELRSELEQLAATRRALAEFGPAVPALAPRVVVLGPRSIRRSWFAFASGFAFASLVLGVGVAAGWGLAFDRPRPAGPSVTAEGARPVTRLELERALSAYHAQVQKLDSENQKLRTLVRQHETTPVLTRDQLERELSEFGRVLQHQHASEMDYLLGEFLDLEQRTDDRIGETQEALRYLFLARDPELSEQ